MLNLPMFWKKEMETSKDFFMKEKVSELGIKGMRILVGKDRRMEFLTVDN